MTRTAVLTVSAFLVALAPAWPCQVAGNLVPNCGFAIDDAGWTAEVGTCTRVSAGSSGPGSWECDSTDGGFNQQVRITRCILASSGIAGNTTYNYGGDGSLVSGVVPTCTVELADFQMDGCLTNTNSTTTPLVPGADPVFAQSVAASYLTGGTTNSARVFVRCLAPSGAGNAFTIRLDDIFVGIGLVPVELLDVKVD